MGNIFKKEVVQAKDVDLTFEPKKTQYKDTSDSFFLIKETQMILQQKEGQKMRIKIKLKIQKV